MDITKLNIKIDNLENSLKPTVCLKNNRFKGFVFIFQNSIVIEGFVNDEFMLFKLYQKDNNEILENEYTIRKNGYGKIVNEIQNAIKLWKNPDQKSLLRK